MRTDHIAKLAVKYTDYEMIKAHTTLPIYPEVRTRLLFAFLQLNPDRDGHSEVCVLATSLAQLGLDTHDMVNSTPTQELIGQARSRQLKVLAGDYYNSRFYQLLSQIGRVDMIRLVSAAISEVNRMKMNFYQRFKAMKLSADEYMDQSVSMKSELFLALSTFIPESYQVKWSELLNLLTRCEVIQNELERSDRNETFRDSWAFCYMLEAVTPVEKERLLHVDKSGFISLMSKFNIHGLLIDMLHTHMQQAIRIMEHLESEALRSEIMRILQSFNSSVRIQQVAKEI
jgi:heptaprenyl diphosphate synthase